MPLLNINTIELAKHLNTFLKNKKVIILFYMNNCGHCMELRPIWDKIIAKTLKTKDIYILEIEESFLQYIPKKYRVLGFPSILAYNNGLNVKEFNDKRTIKNIEKFIIDYGL
jgi:thioredoxin-like negative regulator of GroEL